MPALVTFIIVRCLPVRSGGRRHKVALRALLYVLKLNSPNIEPAAVYKTIPFYSKG